MSNVIIKEIYEKSWALVEPDMVTSFLFEGEEKALLLDCGWEADNIKELAQGLTDKPITLVLSHADYDHVNCCADFDEVWMHPAEYSFFLDESKRREKAMPLWDGDVLNLGGRRFRVIHAPGHTPGSLMFLDMEKRRLFSGDGVGDGLYMFGPQRSLPAHVHSLERLVRDFGGDFDLLYPSHGAFPLEPGIIPKLVTAIEKILREEVEGLPCWEGDEVVRSYNVDGFGIFYEAPDKRKYL